MRQLSITFDYLERPDTVLQIYQQTLPYLNEVSPLLQACIYAGVSGTYTQLKQEKEASRYLEMAYEHFPEKPECEPSFLQTICWYSALILCEGLHHLGFDRLHKAEAAFAKTNGWQVNAQMPARIHVDILNCRTETFIALKNLEQACEYLELAVKSALVLGSQKRLIETFVVFQKMQNVWPHEQRLKRFTDLFQSHLMQ